MRVAVYIEKNREKTSATHHFSAAESNLILFSAANERLSARQQRTFPTGAIK